MSCGFRRLKGKPNTRQVDREVNQLLFGLLKSINQKGFCRSVRVERRVSGFALGCFVGILAGVPACSRTGGSPGTANAGVPIKTYSHNFGILRPSDSVSHDFLIENADKIAWTIDRVESTCGCAVPSVSRKRVLPGGSTSVKVTFQAPDAKYANVRRHVTVRFAEASKPEIRLAIQAAIRAPVVLSPKAVRLNVPKVQQNSSPSAVVTASNFSGQTWSKLEVHSEQAWLSAVASLVESGPKADEDIAPIQVWAISVKVNAESLKPGYQLAELALFTPGSHDAACTLPVAVTIEEPIEVTPSRLFPPCQHD